MATLFTKIIDGELPGRFVWRDDVCVAFMTIAPLKPGHVLVVPRVEVEHWLDLPDDVWQHLTTVSRTIGAAIQDVWQPEKVAVLLAGLEVPHVHVHLSPIWTLDDLSFANADPNASAESLDDAAAKLRAALRAGDASGVVDS